MRFDGLSSIGAPAAVALAVFGSAVLDLVLRGHAIGWQHAARTAAHDPPKVFFHLVLLPLATWFLMRRLPVELVTAAWRHHRIVAVVTAVVLLAIVGWWIATDPPAGLCERTPMPEDVASLELRSRLITLLVEGHAAVSRARRPAGDPTVDAQKVRAQTLQAGMTARRNYDVAVTASRGASPCAFWAQSSLRAKWAAVLTLEALLVLALIFWLLLMHGWTGSPLNATFREALLVVVALLTPWFALRIYSEWWLNFATPISYRPIYVAGALAVVVVVLIFSFERRGTAIVIGSALVTGISTAATFLKEVQPELFETVALAFAELEMLPLISVYAIVGLAVIAVIRFIVVADPAKNDSAVPSRSEPQRRPRTARREE